MKGYADDDSAAAVFSDDQVTVLLKYAYFPCDFIIFSHKIRIFVAKK